MDNARYRAFLLAAEMGSIKNAADTLGYTSSAVSQLIKTLETELNTTLFIRGNSGVSLTTSGTTLLPIIQRIVADEDLLRETAAEINGMILGTINVAAYHSISAVWMPGIIGTFQRKYPDVRINLYEGTQQDLIDRLISGKSDITFFNDSVMKEKHDWIPLMDDPMLAVVPADHPMADEPVFPVKKFDGERFIMTEHGFDYDVMHILKESDVKPRICLSTFDSYILMEMIEQHLGISIVNGLSLNNREKEGRLKAIPLDPFYSLEMGIAVRSLSGASPAVLRFIECAENYVRGIGKADEK